MGTLEDEPTTEKGRREQDGTVAFECSRITGGVASGVLVPLNIIIFLVAILNPVQSMDANRSSMHGAKHTRPALGNIPRGWIPSPKDA